MTTFDGVDVASPQGLSVDWTRAARVGVKFAVAKATQGNDSVDPTFRRNWTEIRRAGIYRGAYGFADPDLGHGSSASDGKLEAEHLVRTVEGAGGLQELDLLALDLEQARKVGVGPQFVAWTLAYLDRVEELTGRLALVYTGGPFFDEHDGDPDAATVARLARHPLWLAAYVHDPDRFVPKAWRGRGWSLWQRSGNFDADGRPGLRVDGIQVVVDHDEFRGDEAAYRAFVRSTYAATSPSPPPAQPPVVAQPLGSDLRSVQAELVALGYDLGPAGADGVLGPRTLAAVRAFQAREGLKVDGVVGPRTFAALEARRAERLAHSNLATTRRP